MSGTKRIALLGDSSHMVLLGGADSAYKRLCDVPTGQLAENFMRLFIKGRGNLGVAKQLVAGLVHNLRLEFAQVISEPLDMILFCPRCSHQHVDAPQPEKGWTNPPHRSHECQSCGHVWRPADLPTNGVATITTKGKADGSNTPASATLTEFMRLYEDGLLGTDPLVVDAYNEAVDMMGGTASYQQRVQAFMLACFGDEHTADTKERNHRFLEESLELVQSLGCSAEDAHMLVDYVFGRPAGEPHQETGGVAVTLAALCNAAGVNIVRASEDELRRVWLKIEVIREKQKRKPRGTPLPGASA
jgi:hypothetical protein